MTSGALAGFDEYGDAAHLRRAAVHHLSGHPFADADRACTLLAEHYTTTLA